MAELQRAMFGFVDIEIQRRLLQKGSLRGPLVGVCGAVVMKVFPLT